MKSPTGLSLGQALDSGREDVGQGRLWLHQLINAAVAAVWLGYVLATFSLWLQTGGPVYLILVLRNTALTSMFLVRRPAEVISRNVKEWIVAVTSTFGGYFFSGGSMLAKGFALPIMLLAGVLMTVSILALGRSFGIVPANRGIKTTGPYRLVRHPLYSCYILFDIGYLMGAPTLRNGVVFISILASLYLRARYEERILRRDPEYRSYAERTPWMFIPSLF